MWTCAQSCCPLQASWGRLLGIPMNGTGQGQSRWNKLKKSGSDGNLRGGILKNLTIALENRPGALAEMGEVLGRAGVSIEGGGVFVVNGQGVANFLFSDAAAARAALECAGIRVLGDREVLVQRLRQGEPSQLGSLARRMAEAGVNIEVQYSD